MKFPELSDIAKGVYIGSLSDIGWDDEGEYITVEKHLTIDGDFTADDLRKIADWIDKSDAN